MKDELLEIIGKAFPLREVDAGEFRKMKVSGMRFTVTPYDAQGLGRVCTMDVRGFAGLMKMTTVIVNPFYKDAPLLSLDRFLVAGTESLFLEPFDTCLRKGFDETELLSVTEKYASVPDGESAPRWYDDMRLSATACKKGRKIADKTEPMAKEYFEAFVRACLAAPACDAEKKRLSAAKYSDGLIEKGGPATDPFLKKFGKAKTAEFFRRVLFGAGSEF